LFVREPLKQWSEGRVTLLGDACHSMVPYLGQGVNMAIEDACVIARCLAENPDDPATAFLTYQNARIERTAKVVHASAAMQATFHHKALGEVKAAGEYIQEKWSPQANSERYNWIYQYDATTVPLHEPVAAKAV
jgi:salicylate hydroxylase